MKEVQELKASLSKAVFDTMENMTFEEVEIIDNEEEVVMSTENLIWSVLPLNKPYAGELVVRVSKDYGKALAEEVLGLMAGEVSDETVTDILAEIANTLAGRFMDNLVPSDEEFQLGLPRAASGHPAEGQQEVVSIPVKVGEHAMIVSVSGKDFVELVKN
ncbi:MAG: chemotaxis protein CheX [bacterium]